MPKLTEFFSISQVIPSSRKVGRKLSAAVLAASVVVMGSTPALADVPLFEGDNGHLNIGGAMRFRYKWDEDSEKQFKSARLATDLSRVKLNGEYGNLIGSAQYHFYSRDAIQFQAIQHAWLGWKLGEDSDIRAGVIQVPLGLLPIASQNFWMNVDYYLGLDDDPDTGIVWQSQNNGHQWHVGVFAGDEYTSSRRVERYSYDVGGNYREREQLAVRYEHSTQLGSADLKLGSGLRVGKIEHLTTNDKELHTAASLHAELKQGGWLTQLQWKYYHYDVPGNVVDLVGFYDKNIKIASAAHVPTLNVAYTLPNAGWFDGIMCYNNFSSVIASGVGLGESHQNVTGCEITKGKVVTYIDWVASRNAYSGSSGSGFGIYDKNEWGSFLNVNIGYYF